MRYLIQLLSSHPYAPVPPSKLQSGVKLVLAKSAHRQRESCIYHLQVSANAFGNCLWHAFVFCLTQAAHIYRAHSQIPMPYTEVRKSRVALIRGVWSMSTHTLPIDHWQYCNGWTPFQQIQLFVQHVYLQIIHARLMGLTCLLWASQVH